MDCTQRNHDAPDHTAELTKLRARLYSPELSALEAAAMLAATELLRAHERGDFEICDNGNCVSLISLCLGSPSSSCTTRRRTAPAAATTDRGRT